mgnify:CR=1 FL=1
MKKYIYEANKKQWEKPTEPKYVFCPPAQVTVYAENGAEADEKAALQFRDMYQSAGVILGDIRQVAAYDLPVDWNYGYGDARGTGTPEDKAALYADNKR